MHRFSAQGLGNAGSRGSAAPPRKIWSLGRKLHMALLTITFIICIEVPPPYRPIALTVSTIWRDGVKINASCYMINLIFLTSTPRWKMVPVRLSMLMEFTHVARWWLPLPTHAFIFFQVSGRLNTRNVGKEKQAKCRKLQRIVWLVRYCEGQSCIVFSVTLSNDNTWVRQRAIGSPRFFYKFLSNRLEFKSKFYRHMRTEQSYHHLIVNLWRWRQLNWRIGLNAALWLQAKVRDRRFGLPPRLYAGCLWR